MTTTDKLADALRNLLPFVITQVLEHCDGTKCREQWCAGCMGEGEAEAAVEKAMGFYREALAALAEHDATTAEVMYGTMDGADFESDTITLKMEPGYFAQAGRFELRRVGPAHPAKETQS